MYRAAFENLRIPSTFKGQTVYSKYFLKEGKIRQTYESAEKDIAKEAKKGCLWDRAYVEEILS